MTCFHSCCCRQISPSSDVEIVCSQPTYKKSKVCRVIKHAMMTWCTFDFTEGDSLPSLEANR